MPAMSADHAPRKSDHLRIALDGDVGFDRLRTGLDEVQVMPRALPGLALADVDLALDLWGRRLAAPLLLSCMTGGTTEAGAVNRSLAIAAQEHGVALGLGSGRMLLDGGAPESFAVRDVAPDVLLLANLGAVQLHEYGVEECRRLVALCSADALVLHLNAVQEAVQPGGDTDFGGLVGLIAAVCTGLDVPVIVKEVGFGLAPADVGDLVSAGVAGVDVAGAGGTNWARIEGRRDTRAGAVADAFTDWGLPTADAVRGARQALDAHPDAAGTVLVGSGGLRHGVDALKVLCLGADLAGVARGVLAAAAQGPEAAVEAVGVLVDQLRIGAWAAGAGTRDELGPALLSDRPRPSAGPTTPTTAAPG
jgi:isopentenyl-diphosphate Delta-isomerase